MKTVLTPKGSPNIAIQRTSAVDPSRVGCSNDWVDRCPRASARGYLLVSPCGAWGLHRIRYRICATLY